MEIFLNLWNNWTSTEKTMTGFLFLIILVLIPGITYYITKKKSLTLFSIVSLLSSGFLTVLGITFLSVVFQLTITYIFLLVPVVILFINILNISTCIGYYKHTFKKDSFLLQELKREYIRDSIQLTIFLLLLFSALSVFLYSTFLVFILLTGILCVSVVWINYALIYWLVKNND